MIHVAKKGKLTVRRNGEEITLLVDGRYVCSLSWGGALNLAKVLQAEARKIEEIEKHEQVAFDHGLLLRAGVPLGLAFNAKVQQLGEHNAAWNSKLRRYMPGGVRSQEKFGVPIVKNAERKVANGRSDK